MSPDDNRHGTYAGAVAHYAHKEPLCEPCREAKRSYSRRQHKEQQMGRARYVDTTLLRRHVRALLNAGMTQADIARAAGLCDETVRLVRNGGPLVNIKTFRAIAAVQVGASETYMPREGAARKIRALAAAGHELRSIAAELGMKPQALANIIHDYKPSAGRVTRKTWDKVDDLYQRLHMTPGPSSRTKAIAAKRGWPPPLAWDDIDDPNETPTDWHYRPPTRLEQFDALVERGAGLTEILRDLRVGRDALEKWAARNGRNVVYSALKAGEYVPTRQGKWAS